MHILLMNYYIQMIVQLDDGMVMMAPNIYNIYLPLVLGCGSIAVNGCVCIFSAVRIQPIIIICMCSRNIQRADLHA